MKYRIIDTKTKKEYTREKLPFILKGVSEGMIYKVNEKLTPIGYFINNTKNIIRKPEE